MIPVTSGHDSGTFLPRSNYATIVIMDTTSQRGPALAVCTLAEETSSRYGMELELIIPDNMDDLPVDVEQCFYRVAQGFTNAEISERLCLTRGTVGNYVSSILAKLGVETRTQAAILAVRHGLVKE